MTTSRPAPKQSFGKRKNVNRIIIANGQSVRSYTIHPALASGALVFALFLGVGYLVATGYLMFRDDLLNASVVKQARMQHAYEDRLALLRSEIDRITSRQLLSQQSVETKLDQLLGMRAVVDTRAAKISALADVAKQLGINPTIAPIPRPRPNADGVVGKQAMFAPATQANPIALGYAAALPKQNAASLALKSSRQVNLSEVEQTFAQRRAAQVTQLRLMVDKIGEKANGISSVLRDLGYRVPSAPEDSELAIGGPLEPISTEVNEPLFDSYIEAFKLRVDHLDDLKRQAGQIPFLRPIGGGSISSNFGRRVDPFTKRYAMHSGIDFKATRGTAVRATGPGKVIFAGWKGGYGKVVEVEHSNGITSRYAHLSRISRKVGDRVAAGQKLGSVGSTGRSTGPHLHYETRIRGNAVNPRRFLDAGLRLSRLF